MPRSTRTIARVPIDSVTPNPRQPRRAFSDAALSELAASIRENGLLQPVAVRALPGGGYELIAGERRLRACARLGHATIEAVIVRADAEQSALLALVENLQREDLHYLDEAEAYAEALRALRMTQEELARRVGLSQSAVANKIRLLRLEAEVRESLRRLNLSERHARALLRLPGESLRRAAARAMAEQRLSAGQADALVTGMLAGLAPRAPEEPPPPAHARRVVPLPRDNRLHVNAIGEAVRQIRLAGAEAQMEVAEREGGVDVTVRIRAGESRKFMRQS